MIFLFQPVLLLVLTVPAPLLPADPSSEITVLHDLVYCPGSSQRCKLDLAYAKGSSTPRPAILVIHGGGWIEGDKSSFASRDHGVPGNIVDFAALGFVAATMNYRLAGEAPYPAALEDCQCAVRWLRTHAREYHIDPDHIGVYGNSAGGHLALLLGMPAAQIQPKLDAPYADRSSRVQAAASDSGPIDLAYQFEQNRLREVVKRFMGNVPEKTEEAYRKASPMRQISKDCAPLLLIYGGADEQVPIESADRFVMELTRAGVKDVSYHRLARAGHCPHSLERVPSMTAAVNEFFRRTLEQPVKENGGARKK
jgi:acetyl esterase/lipase